MDPTNQPSSLGFAYVAIVAGAIDVVNTIYRGAITGAVRRGDGAYDITVEGLEWPWNFSVTVFNSDNTAGHGIIAVPYWPSPEQPSITFLDQSFAPTDPDTAFMVSITGT